MSGLFKKTSWNISKEVKHFFQKLFSSLPSEFQFLQDGLNKGLYQRYRFNKGNNYSISFDPCQSDESMVKDKNFEIKNIVVFSEGQQYRLDLTIYEGLWIGFNISKNVKDFNSYDFDVSKIEKSNSKFALDDNIERLMKGLQSKKLDLHDLSEIEVEGRRYYQIKDLEDGNYIAIDNKGQVYGLMHDPFKIVLLNNSVKNFVERVNNDEFKFEEFLQN